MLTTSAHLLADVADALVPRDAPIHRRREFAVMFLRSLPLPARFLFMFLLWSFWCIAFILRRGTHSHRDAIVAWIAVCVASQKPLPHSIGLWFKATACLIVLGDTEQRRALYQKSALALPSDVLRLHEEQPPKDSVRPKKNQSRAVSQIDEADYVIVGSGPAGATVARTLAQAGHSVLMLEEGPQVPVTWMADSTLEVLASHFRAGAAMTTLGPDRIPVLQGRGVGGSSLVNSAIVWRAPEDVFASWYAADTHLASQLSLDRIARAYEAIEKAVQVEETPRPAFSHNNTLMEHAAKSMGIVAQPTKRYTRGCEGLGRCLEGCPRGRKMSMNATFIPEAIAHGARLYANCQVGRVISQNGKAVGVQARLQGHADQAYFKAHKGVVVAASAIATPILLRKSGLRHKSLGERFQAHPGASIAAIFDTPVREKFGATQGFDSIHFRAERRFKLETLTLPDELIATRFPGVGPAFSASLDELPYTACWAGLIRSHAHGSVRGGFAMPMIHFHMTPQDRLNLGRALKTLGEMFFAAGARELLPGIVGFKERMSHPDDLKGLEDGVSPNQLAMITSHLFGTAVMGTEPSLSVCDPMGRVHQFDNLYVADSSLFPTNLGVNPQHTIMALAQHVAWGILGDQMITQ